MVLGKLNEVFVGDLKVVGQWESDAVGVQL